MKAAFDNAMTGNAVQIERNGVVYELRRVGWVMKSEKLKDLLVTDFEPDREGLKLRAEVYPTKSCPNGHIIPEGRSKCNWKGCKYG